MQKMYILFIVLVVLLVTSSVLFYGFNEPYYNPLNNSAFNEDSPNWTWQNVDENKDNICRPCGKTYNHC